MGWGVLGCRPNTTGLRVAGGMPGKPKRIWGCYIESSSRQGVLCVERTQSRSTRLSEMLWSSHWFILAQARQFSLSETGVLAWANRYGLSENGDESCFYALCMHVLW